MTGQVQQQLAYGTCVALNSVAALLQGPPGSGKSDLALRFVIGPAAAQGSTLVADDQVLLERTGDRLIARPPATIAGKIEVRGVGILDLPFRQDAELRLVIRLTTREEVPRLPELGTETAEICGVTLPVLTLAPFDASAPLKLRLLLERLA